MSTERDDRLILVQVHVSALLLLAACLFGAAAARVAAQPRYGRTGLVLLTVAAALATIAALGPWLWRQRVSGQRACIAATLMACGGGLVAMLPGLGYIPAISAQAALAAGILSELGPRKGALAWFWGTALALVVPAALYWWLAGPYPLSD